MTDVMIICLTVVVCVAMLAGLAVKYMATSSILENALAKYEKAYQSVLNAARDDRTRAVMREDAIERTLYDTIREMPKHDTSALDVAIKELNERCEKNSKAIVNTAESLQKLLNEKFTALALSRGVNQK